MRIKLLGLCLSFIFFANVLYARIPVTVSILPQKFFVEKIGGNAVVVNVMVLPGSNPAVYEPKPKQMVMLKKSKIYFAIGVPFEMIWLDKFKKVNPDMKIVLTQKGINRLPMVKRKKTSGREILDPHIWLSPELVKKQCETIKNVLSEIDIEKKDLYEKNFRKFLQEIDEVNNKIKTILRNSSGKKFIVFHPSWGYFARDYNLIQIPIEIEGKAPKPKDLNKLIRIAKKENIKVVFVQPQFSSAMAETIAKQINGKIVKVDPLAENWSENILKAAKAFAKELK
jgi:zinc transport system substrate-binding protein